MIFLDFQNTFAHLRVIPKIEIKKRFPNFDWNALTRWQKKGYIVKIRNGHYRFSQQKIRGDLDLFFIANQIYRPSYISLESALKYYNLIPEGVFTITSITTKKTQKISTPDAAFAYRSLRKNLFFGYRFEEIGEYRFKIATPAKALLDFLYLNPHIETKEDFFEWRLNVFELQSQISWAHFEAYLELFDSRALTERAARFKTFIHDNN